MLSIMQLEDFFTAESATQKACMPMGRPIMKIAHMEWRGLGAGL